MAAPNIHFMIMIYDFNVDKLGRIYLDILKARAWTKLYTMSNT